MSFFESLLVLLAVAVCLLQISHRLSIPYPTMLAAAGVGLALIPGAPTMQLEPATALALFIAPALCDAAFEFPVGAVWRLSRPLLAFAVVAVLLSTVSVAWIGVELAGLPAFAALALGAIVAPPDAAAATAILSTVQMPRRTVAILKGESLLNDATALLIFTAALAFQSRGGLDGLVALHLGLAAPGGLLLGYVLAKLLAFVMPVISGILSAYLFEYLMCFAAWIVADHLGLSAVLCVVAFAMTCARAPSSATPPRTRLHNVAVSHTSIFLLNVLAFLLMGLQSHSIISGMEPERLTHAAWFSAAVVVCLIVVRMAWVLVYNRLASRFKALRGEIAASSIRHGVLAGWCGMRGLVTFATAFALPMDFPQRDLIVLTAFAVVLATLVVQGLTLAPLVRLLKLDGEDGFAAELTETRADMARAGVLALREDTGPTADHWRFVLHTVQKSAPPLSDLRPLVERRQLGVKALEAQRARLELLRHAQQVSAETFVRLQEELDFSEVALTAEHHPSVEDA